MSVAKRPQAKIDLDDIAAHLAENAGEDLALRFLDAVKISLNRIAGMPKSGLCSNATIRG